MQLEYDEKGGSFYYFLLSFYVLLLIPFTIFVCRRKQSKEKGQKNQNICHCYLCRIKRHQLKSNPWKHRKQKGLKFLLICAWILFVVLLYKVSQVEMEWAEFDPYAELGVDRGASVNEVKKAYRGLTMQHHPDRGGDPKRFMRIARAYAALTDEKARKNWELHGNPDGPGATQFGIALPKWIVEKQNSIWVLGIYTFVFMILLPVGVGTWWYRSIKYGGEEVLLNTIRLYFYVFRHSPNIILQRGLTILSGSLEFEKSHNPEIQERPSDNEELPALLKQFPSFNIKSKEKPFCYPYSVKSRLLLYAHLNRYKLPQNTLEVDRQYIVKKCPYLINQMVNMIAYIVCLGGNGQQHVPNLETLENIMKLSPMVVQALWDRQSPLLQLPHITEDMQRHFVTRKRNIKTVRQLIEMQEEERRSLLRTLSDEQIRDVMAVAGAMPSVEMNVEVAVIEDDDQTITAGSLVTVSVKLLRQNMIVHRPAQPSTPTTLSVAAGANHFSTSASIENVNSWDGLPNGEDASVEDGTNAAEAAAATAADGDAKNAASTPKKTQAPKPWQKNRNKKKGPKGPGAKQTHKKKTPHQPAATGAKPAAADERSVAAVKEDRRQDDDQISCNGDMSGSDIENEDPDDNDVKMDSVAKAPASTNVKKAKSKGADGEEKDSDNEEGWQRYQADVRKENSLETKETTKHSVHCPYYPAEKLEYWWLYIADKKARSLVTPPMQIRSLQSDEEVPLKFTAPMEPGPYVFTVCLRSDSYLHLDVFKNIKIEVLQARFVEDHPQWDISDEDDDDHQLSGSDHEADVSDDSPYDYSE